MPKPSAHVIALALIAVGCGEPRAPMHPADDACAPRAKQVIEDLQKRDVAAWRASSPSAERPGADLDVDLVNERTVRVLQWTSEAMTAAPACGPQIQEAATYWWKTNQSSVEADAKQAIELRAQDRRDAQARLVASLTPPEPVRVRPQSRHEESAEKCEETRETRRQAMAARVAKRDAAEHRSKTDDARADYIKKHCKSIGIPLTEPGLCEDEAGNVTACQKPVGIRPGLRCPDSGPPGMPRGAVPSGPYGDSGRVAWSHADAVVDLENHFCVDSDVAAGFITGAR
jgi:hypothetical protein